MPRAVRPDGSGAVAVDLCRALGEESRDVGVDPVVCRTWRPVSGAVRSVRSIGSRVPASCAQRVADIG